MRAQRCASGRPAQLTTVLGHPTDKHAPHARPLLAQVMPVASTRAAAPAAGCWLTLDADGLRVPSWWYMAVVGVATRLLEARLAAASRARGGPAAAGPGVGGSWWSPILWGVSRVFPSWTRSILTEI